MTDSRTYTAWSIFWTWTRTGETMPTYKQIDGGLPWFRTKKQATEFLQSLNPSRKRNAPIKWSVRKVTLTMSWEDQ